MDRGQLQEPREKPEVGVVIVTHNSGNSISQTLSALNQQTYTPSQVVLVDSGSFSTHYLKEHDHQGTLEMCFMPNIGFSAANNLGYSSLFPSTEFVLFLNPDVILPPDLLEKIVQWMSEPGRENVGACSPLLLGWDLEKEKSTGLIDSAGIATTWYGHWYDRGRGVSAKYHPFKKVDFPDALCGAFMFCRKSALESIKIPKSQIFDERFFCYKEDIDLSLRLKKKGWQLCYLPDLIAFHARGWHPHRKKVPKELRLMSAANEFTLHSKTGNPVKMTYSFLKWVGVRFFDL